MINNFNQTQLNKFRQQINQNQEFINDKNPQEDSNKKFSKAVSMSVLREYFSLDQNAAFEAITDGDGDNKIDAFYYSDYDDELGELILIQSKYKNTDGDIATFTEDDIKLCLRSAQTILDGNNFQDISAALSEKIITYRSRLADAGLPGISIKIFFATNGVIHNEHKSLSEVKEALNIGIESIFVDATTHFGNELSSISSEIIVNQKSGNDKTDSIFNIEDSDYSGIVASCNISNLISFYESGGTRLLLSENVRFLIKNSSINKEIKSSFINEPEKFCYLNNGVSIICSAYEEQPTGHSATRIIMTAPYVVNGGQTLATLYQIFTTQRDDYIDQFNNAKILIRIYKAPNEYGLKIAKATNSQNPIRIVDLHSNDNAQLVAKSYFEQKGIGLITKVGEDTAYFNDTITNENILQIYAALYCGDPAKAKVSKSFIFKKYYSLVFNESINEEVFQKLFRCYSLAKFINTQNIDHAVKKNAFYSIIYLMGQISENIKNFNIPDNSMLAHYNSVFDASLQTINTIIETKQRELRTKFSMNNLFKGSEIKDLIDLAIEAHVVE